MNDFSRRFLSLANQLEQLSSDLAASIPTLDDEADRLDVQTMSDELFYIQSGFRYSYHAICESIWN